MIALQLPDVATAQALSAGLWRLHRPEIVASHDTTQYFAGWRQVQGGALLLIDPNWTFAVHPRVAGQMSDPTDAAGSQAAMAALLAPLASGPASLMQIGQRIAQGGQLQLRELLAFLRPEIVLPSVPALVPPPAEGTA